MSYSCYAIFVFFINFGILSWVFDILQLLGYIRVLIKVAGFS